MAHSDFSFTVELHSQDVILARTTVDPSPYVEDSIFRAVLTGVLPNDGNVPPVTVTPLWEGGSRPAISGLRVALAGGQEITYGTQAFALRARILLGDMLRNQRLKGNTGIRWRAVATERRPAAGARFHARVVRAPYSLRPARLRGVAGGELAVTAEPSVLAAIAEELKAAGTVERAGLLAGHLLHDPEAGAAVVVVSDVMPVTPGSGGASAAHFAFAPDSLLTARRALVQRPDDAITVGWWHSHPPCAECPRKPECNLDTVFLSSDDARVHLSAFGAAYMTALVAGKLADRPATHPGVRCYGWARGTIAERTLHVSAEGNLIEHPMPPPARATRCPAEGRDD